MDVVETTPELAARVHCDALTEAEDDVLWTREREEGLELMLEECYGIAWTINMKELTHSDGKEGVDSSGNPEQIFSLTMPRNKVHRLHQVEQARLCRVNLNFGIEIVAGILDTGAQRSLLNVASYDLIKSVVPPLLQPPSWCRGLMGATGTQLTVHGELRRCPFLLNGFQYHCNLVVAELGVINAIIGMDFLKAYGAIIDLDRDQVTLSAGLQINTVVGGVSLPQGGGEVRLSRDTAIETGALVKCSCDVDVGGFNGTFVFESTSDTGEDHCFIAAQIVNVQNGCIELFVEHRGAGPAWLVPRGKVLGRVSEISTTVLHTSNCEPNTPILATYCGAISNPIAWGGIEDPCVGVLGKDEVWEYPLTFDLCGEVMAGETAANNIKLHRYADPFMVIASPVGVQRGSISSLARGAEALGVAGQGATVLDIDGLPVQHHVTAFPQQRGRNVGRSRHEYKVAKHREECADDASTSLIDSSIPVLTTLSPTCSVDAYTTVCMRLPVHLRCVMPAVGEGTPLTVRQAEEAVQLIMDFEDTFVAVDGIVGWTNQAVHSVDTGVSRPVKQPPRRTGFEEKDQIEKQISDLLLEDKIQASESPWASPVLLIKKKDGSWRFCIDYRRLNEATVKDAYPLPRIDEALDHLSGAKWFHTMDLASGYWQVAMNPDDREKTAFCTHMGLYEWLVMPFGLCNGPATFERLMERVLSGLVWHGVLVYIDDIVAYGDTWGKALERLKQVLVRLRRANLKLKAKKCFLFRQEVEYLGHVVSREGVKPLTSKISALKHWAVPVNLEELRSFLGLACYYRQFIQDYSEHAAPLNLLTRKDTKFFWGPEQQKEFLYLKESLTAYPCLGTIQRHGLLIVDTDACDVAVGAVLQQKQEGVERVLSYYSKSLNSAQRNYCTTKKELLAIVATLNHWDVYLSCVSEPFVLRTDHAALTWLRTMACRDKAMLRWCDAVNKYNFDLQHRPGAKHQNADALSRVRLTRCGWEGCGDCKEVLLPLADEDDILTRHNEELTISAPPAVVTSSAELVAAAGVRKSKRTLKQTPVDLPPDAVVLRRSSRVASRLLAASQKTLDPPTTTGQATRLPRDNEKSPLNELEASDRSNLAGSQKDMCSRKTALLKRQSEQLRLVGGDQGDRQNNASKVVLPPTLIPHIKNDAGKTTADVTVAERDIAVKAYLKSTDWEKAQMLDPAIKRTRELMKEYESVAPTKVQLKPELMEVKAICQHWNLLEIIKGVVTRTTSDLTGQKSFSRLVPVSMRIEIFKRIHGYDMGHFGYDKIYPLFSERFFWPGMSTDIKTWLNCCEICQKTKPGKGKGRYGLVQEIAGAPMERCGIDLSGPWPTSRAKNVYLCVIQDYFSKWIEIFAIPDKTAVSVAKCLVVFMARYGKIAKLHSDMGQEFQAKVTRGLCDMWSVTKTYTTPYTPWSDGMVERANRTIKRMLKVYCQQMIDVWDEYTWCLMQAYNCTVHASTGFTPFVLMHSRCENPDLPLDILYASGRHDLVERELLCNATYLVEQKEKMLKIHDLVRNELHKSAGMQQRGQIQGGLKMRQYFIGQSVWWYFPPAANQKLKYPWTGPYQVIDVAMEKNVVRIRRENKDSWVHASSLKPVIKTADGQLL